MDRNLFTNLRYSAHIPTVVNQYLHTIILFCMQAGYMLLHVMFCSYRCLLILDYNSTFCVPNSFHKGTFREVWTTLFCLNKCVATIWLQRACHLQNTTDDFIWTLFVNLCLSVGHTVGLCLYCNIKCDLHFAFKTQVACKVEKLNYCITWLPWQARDLKALLNYTISFIIVLNLAEWIF